ncbi:MAG: hypothetical protein PHH08_00830 [Candidatus ainarchaeum sp.]|nr:hypothetical protein [Candidatus ainarchaeum sp.]
MKLKIALLVLFFAVIFSAGCIQTGFDSEFQKLTEMQQRYGLGEQLAPASLNEIAVFKGELSKMKQQTKDAAFSSFIDARINAAETMENLLLSDLEMQRINPADIDCTVTGPLSKGKAFLDKAYKKSETAKARIEAFKSSYPTLAEKVGKAGFDEARMDDLKKAAKEQFDNATMFWLENCEK